MNKKIIFGIIGLFVIGGGLFATISLVQKQKILRSQATPATELFLRPASASASPGEKTTFNIVINTGENTVAAASLQLLYDPNLLIFTDITPGSFFDSPVVLNEDTSIPGKITYELGASPNSPAQSDGQTLARIQFTVSTTAVPDNSTQVKFLLSTQVSAIQEGGKNVLLDSHNATINIQSGGSDPTPSPVASSPTPIPSSIPPSPAASSPTPIPSSVPSPAASSPTPLPVVASPVPTSSLVSSPTPSQLPQTGVSLTTMGIVSASLLILISFLFFI